MKKSIIILLLFSSGFIFSQAEKDTITVHFNDIIYKIDTAYNTRTKPVITKRKINKHSGKLLNGLYKVITEQKSFFITKYKGGLSDDSVFNYVKYYYNDNLYKIDIKGQVMIGSKYISISEYNCAKKRLKGCYVDLTSNKIIETIRIKQKIKKKYILWKITSKNGTNCIRLNREMLTDCD